MTDEVNVAARKALAEALTLRGDCEGHPGGGDMRGDCEGHPGGGDMRGDCPDCFREVIAAAFRPLLAERDAALAAAIRRKPAELVWAERRAFEAEREATEAQSALCAITRALIAADPGGESDETDLEKLALEGIAKLVEERGAARILNHDLSKRLHYTGIERMDEAHEHALTLESGVRAAINIHADTVSYWDKATARAEKAEVERDAALRRVREERVEVEDVMLRAETWHARADRAESERDQLRAFIDSRSRWMHKKGIKAQYHDRHSFDFESCNSAFCVQARRSLAPPSAPAATTMHNTATGMIGGGKPPVDIGPVPADWDGTVCNTHHKAVCIECAPKPEPAPRECRVCRTAEVLPTPGYIHDPWCQRPNSLKAEPPAVPVVEYTLMDALRASAGLSPLPKDAPAEPAPRLHNADCKCRGCEPPAAPKLPHVFATMELRDAHDFVHDGIGAETSGVCRAYVQSGPVAAICGLIYTCHKCDLCGAQVSAHTPGPTKTEER